MEPSLKLRRLCSPTCRLYNCCECTSDVWNLPQETRYRSYFRAECELVLNIVYSLGDLCERCAVEDLLSESLSNA